MGKAAAVQTVKNGGKALLVSRSADKLQQAKEQIQAASGCNIERIRTKVLDASDEAAVQAFANELSNDDWEFHYLIISAAGKAPHGPMTELPTSDARSMMESKFWTAYNAAKYINPKLKEGGSITFVSGVLGRRPGVNCCPLAVTNGALEGLTRSLALELGPRLRVNCLSPGFCDTERFNHMPKERKAAMLLNTADSLPLRRVGQPSDMGEAIHYLASAKFITGVVLDVDGGHSIRQYANANTDPMRKQSD
jgi:NAD(P)-dependent dehydrogenase (short-subunit alcohol dehydrogenase family)